MEIVLRIAALVAALVLLLASYWQGQNGVYVLDDVANLGGLSSIANAGVFDADFWQFVFNGRAGPTGRPVSLFSFALQAQCWPEQVQCFKIFNILLHIFNGVLVFLIIYFLSPGTTQRQTPAFPNTSTLVESGAARLPRAFWLALGVALLWTLHPVHTSVVLYTIQRMALLSNTFILSGILFWLLFRAYPPCGRGLAKYTCWLLVLLSLFLATFSKENGVLLVVYLLLVDYTFGALHGGLSYQRTKQLLYFGFWAGLVAIAIILYDSRLVAGYSVRDFTMTERLLTQPRVLFDYLYAIIQPTQVAGTVFSDFQVSKGLLQPISTLISLLAWFAIIVAACLVRQRLPLIFFAVFWFLTSHAMESTFWPLEMYFLHRNYLAMLGPLLLAGWLVLYLITNFQKLKVPVLFCVLCIALIYGWQVRQIAIIWSDPLLVATDWYRKQPHTERAAEYYAFQLANNGGDLQVREAEKVYSDLSRQYPGKPSYWLMRLMLGCRFESVPTLTMEAIRNNVGPASPANIDGGALQLLDQFLAMHQLGECSYSGDEMRELLDLLPIYLVDDDMRGVVLYMKARLSHNDNVAKSLDFYEEAINLSPRFVIRESYAAYAMTKAHYDIASRVISSALRELDVYHDIEEGSKADIQARFLRLQTQLTAKRQNAVSVEVDSGKS